MHMNNMHKIEGVSFVKPFEILAKLLEAIPKIIPFAKNKYPKRGFIPDNNEFLGIYRIKNLIVIL